MLATSRAALPISFVTPTSALLAKEVRECQKDECTELGQRVMTQYRISSSLLQSTRKLGTDVPQC